MSTPMMMRTIADYTQGIVDKFVDLEPKILHSEVGIAIVRLDASTIFRRLDTPLIMVIANAATLEQRLSEDLNWLDDQYIEYFKQADLFPVVLCLPGNKGGCRKLIQKTPFAQEHPVFSIEKLIGSAAPKKPKEALRKALLDSASIDVLSPYRIDTCTSKRMFFGRERWLKRLHESQGNQYIVGARRIGKSSLALQLQKELGTMVYTSGSSSASKSHHINRCSFVDVGSLGNGASEQIWHHILKGFNLDRPHIAPLGRKAKLIGGSRFDERKDIIDEARALQFIISQYEGKLTIILDEVDEWLHQEAATGWTTIDRLRAMTDHGKAKVILVGYESLEAATGNDLFPLTSRGKLVRLDPLAQQAINELVVLPLEELKLRLNPKHEILERIWQATSGMPHIVQDICTNIVSICLGSAVKNQIVGLSELTSAIKGSGAYADFREGVFQSEFPLAEAIAGIVSFKPSNKPLKNDEIASDLENQGYKYDAKVFRLALSFLELRSVIRPLNIDRSQWLWVNEDMCEAMRIKINEEGYERWLKNLIREHEQGLWKIKYKVLGRLD